MLKLSLIVSLMAWCACSHKPLSDDPTTENLVLQARAVGDDTLVKLLRDRKQKAQFFLNASFGRIKGSDNISWAESRVRFDALEKILFYTKDERFNSILERLYWDLQKANFAKKSDRETVFNFYVRARQVEAATTFKNHLPSWQSKEFPDLPKINFRSIDDGSSFVLDIVSSTQLNMVEFPLNYTGLVIIGSLDCPFTQNALKDILSNKKNLPRLTKNVQLLVPQENLDIKEMNSWNKLHPEIPFRLVFKELSFKELSFGSVPQFYFFRNGKVVQQITGWPKTGRMNDLIEGFKNL